MRFAATLTLALFTASASAFDAEAKMRVLARVEANAARSLQGKGKGNNKKTNGTDEGGGGPKKEKKETGGKGKGRSKWEDSDHSAHLDANDSGIAPNKVEVVYGEALAVDFEVLAEHVPTDVLATLDAEQMSNWKIAIYERMQHVDSSQDPILAVAPTYARRLQETEGEYDPLAGVGEGVAETDEQPEDPDMFDEGGPAVPVTLPISGTATFAAIDAATFQGHGTGFDVVLIDENGEKIIGPGTFYTLKTAEMEEDEEKAKGKKPDHPLARHDHGKKKKASGKKGKGPSKPKEGLGKGSGSNGKMIIETKGALADYVLVTDIMEPDSYAFGATVTVTYDVSSAAGGRRRLQGNNNKGGNKKKKDDEEEPTETDPSPDTTTGATEPVTTTTGIDMGADDGDLGVAPEPEPETIDPMDTSLWTMGVFWRMEAPQGQEPRHSVDLGSVLAGTIAIETDATSAIMKDGNVGGYDAWILDGTGHGQAGPVTFYVDPAP